MKSALARLLAVLVLISAVPLIGDTAASSHHRQVKYRAHAVPPVITSLKPDGFHYYVPSFGSPIPDEISITLTGKHFIPESIVRFAHKKVNTVYHSATELVALVPRDLMLSVRLKSDSGDPDNRPFPQTGKTTVSVLNTPSGAVSTSVKFTISADSQGG